MTSSIESMKRIVLATDQLPEADKTALEVKFSVAETRLKDKACYFRQPLIQLVLN